MKLLAPPLFALALLGPLSVAAQTPPAAAPASAPVLAVRAEVRTALQAAIEQHRGGKAGDALATIDKAIAELKTPPSPVETAFLQRTRGLLLLQLEQYPAAVTALQAALAADVLPAADKLQMTEALMRAQFQAKNYPAAVAAGRQAATLGSTWNGLAPLLTRALFLANDFAGTTQHIEQRLQARTPVGEEDLRILATSYTRIKDEAGYTRTLERLMREHPKAEYWPDLLARAARQPGWQARHDIDHFRLRLVVDAMDEANDYLVLADLAGRAGLPAEALAALEAGYAKGVLGKGSGAAEHQKMRAQYTKLAGEDRANLTGGTLRPPSAADARAAATTLTTGAALVAVGQAERGLEYMKAALGGPLPDPAQAQLQYAVALHRAGRTAEAAKLFETLSGHETLGMLSRLWVIALNPKKG